MSTRNTIKTAVMAAALLLAMGTQGCATKKYVRKLIDPLTARTADLEKKTSTHDGQIEGLDRQVSAANERSKAADSRAQEAAESAVKAQQSADSSGSQAMQAQGLAQKGLDLTETVDRKLSARIEGLDKYKLVSTGSILFGLNKSELSDEAKDRLGTEVEKIRALERFVIQVEGFTDKTGSSAHNLELSRRRADAVVRYLVSTGKIPLYRVHVIGHGNSSPVADNSTRNGRAENRRVEVRIFTAESSVMSAESAQHNVRNP